jgi:hypothetical protein
MSRQEADAIVIADIAVVKLSGYVKEVLSERLIVKIN